MSRPSFWPAAVSARRAFLLIMSLGVLTLGVSCAPPPILESGLALGSVSPQPLLLSPGSDESKEGAYREIARAIGEARVVALGESIHLTREMPAVRLGILKSLHRDWGFEVLALEGSLIETWTAQEHAYLSGASAAERARTFAREAWFGLWQTPEMEAVAAYALSTQSSATPLYLASFDLQPGYAFAHRASSDRALAAFLGAIQPSAPSLTDNRLQVWVRELGPAMACKSAIGGASAVEEITRLIETEAAPRLAVSRPPVHVRTLRLAPIMLRARLAQCEEVAAEGRDVYQASRDRHNASLIEAMLGTEPKIVLWAHHSHVHHNSLGAAPPSMGQHLKAALGHDLYTLGVFANGGSAIDSVLADQGPEGLEPQPVPDRGTSSLEGRLASLEPRDLFVDLRGTGGRWQEPTTSRLEVSGSMRTAPALDFDGAVLLHRVSPPQLTFLAVNGPPPSADPRSAR